MTSEPATWELLSKLQSAHPALGPWMSTCLAGQLPPQWQGALPCPILFFTPFRCLFHDSQTVQLSTHTTSISSGHC